MQLAEAQLELEHIMLHKVRQEDKDRYRMNSNMWAMKIHSKGVMDAQRQLYERTDHTMELGVKG